MSKWNTCFMQAITLCDLFDSLITLLIYLLFLFINFLLIYCGFAVTEFGAANLMCGNGIVGAHNVECQMANDNKNLTKHDRQKCVTALCLALPHPVFFSIKSIAFLMIFELYLFMYIVHCSTQLWANYSYFLDITNSLLSPPIDGNYNYAPWGSHIRNYIFEFIIKKTVTCPLTI